ncbi:MAG: ABC transporter substrate-binding protein [Oscillospiraceae bacterium]|nr:ABC transporter substrate-binding protein [Oscillospiraceae bacterium]
MKQMKQKKGLAALLLAVLLLCGFLLSCAGDNSKDEKNENASDDGASDQAAEAAGDPRDIGDDLPEADLGGDRFSILSRSERNYEFLSEGETGEVINDNVYKRNRKVEDRFNIEIDVTEVMGDWSSLSIFMNAFKNSVLAGDGAYDLVAGYQAYFMSATTDGWLYDINSLPYIDQTKPWWAESVFNELTVNGKLYIMAGDLSLTMWEYMYGIYFNKQMVQDYGIQDDFYKIAREGKWTIDYLDKIVRDIHEDLDGDGKMTKADKFGYATETGNLVDLFMAAFDIAITQKGDDGLPVIVLDSELNIAKLNRVFDFIVDNPGVIHQGESVSTPDNPLDVLFHDNRAMFLPDTLGNSKKLRSFDTDFGILPLPKYNEAQEKYHVYPQNGFSVLAIPADVKNAENAALITEAMCAESYKLVIPAFYDVALKNKFTRDDESGEMIDLIRDGAIFNFGMLYTNIIDHPGVILRSIGSNKNTFVSTLEKQVPKWEANIAKILDKIG